MTHSLVVPAKAGIHAEFANRGARVETAWAPAFAGATGCVGHIREALA
jgi:hypothetical protein